MKSLKFKVLAVLMVLGMVGGTLAGCGGGDSDAGSGDGGSGGAGTYNWKLAHEENDGEDMDIYADFFAEELNEQSDGNITLEIFPVGTLGDTQDLFELNCTGSVEFGITDPGWTMPSIPEVGVFSLHFFFPSEVEDYDKLMEAAANGESKGFEIIDEGYLNQGVTNLHWFVEGGNVWTANKPIEKPEDFKGVKFRTMASDIIAESYKAYGADAVTIPYTEVYSALQLGTADGQVNPLSAIVGSSFYEVQDYAMYAYPDSFIASIHANTTFWEGLTDDERELIQNCANAAYDRFIEQRAKTLEERAAVVAENCEVIEFTDEMREPFKEIAEQNRQIFTDTVDNGQEIVDAFQEDMDTILGE